MKSLLLFLFLLLSSTIYSQSISKRLMHFNSKNGIINYGYDLVSYFELNKSQKGNASISYTYMGQIYHFASQAHRSKFIANPMKYEPQYGGWCAYAMGASGEKVAIDPETFKIVQGKLYLFYHTWINNTLNKWNDDELNLKNSADKNWTITLK